MDADAPRLEITLTPAAFNGPGDDIVATFTFTEVVTGSLAAGATIEATFELVDVTVDGGTKPGSLTESTDLAKAGKVWTGTFTTSGNSGNLVVTVGANSVQDSVGNTGPASSVSKTATRDTTAPGVTISGVPAYLVNTAAFPAAFTFDEAVSGFAQDDVTVSNGVLGNLTAVAAAAAGTAWSAQVTPDGQGDVKVEVRKDAVTDVAGNTGPAVAESETATYDAVAPGLTITLVPAAFNAASDRIEAAFTFSEAVSGFAADDVTVSNGALGNLTAVAAAAAGTAWSAQVTPNGNGDVEVTVLANRVTDVAGNTGPADAVAETAVYDAVAPTLTITLDPAAFNAASATIVAAFTFSEVVTDFELVDITVDGGTKPAVALVASLGGKVYTGTFTSTGDSGNLVVTVRVDAARDSGGNTGPASPVIETAVRDTTPPAVSYRPPGSLQVGKTIAPMSPLTSDTDKNSHSYSPTLLPAGLTVHASTGDITGTPATAGLAVTGTVTVTDAAGNISLVSINFPEVVKGEQTLSDFGYGAMSQRFNATPALTAPAGVAPGVVLVYSTTTPNVCAVDSVSGALTFKDVGTCTITVTAPGNTNYDEGAKDVTVTVQRADYDADNDGLIEITKLEQLNAMRWDLNGDGGADSSGKESAYEAAFPGPGADAGAGEGALGCSNDSGAAAPCTGYELKADLDFDTDGSYADTANKTNWTSSSGWLPVGNSSHQFAAAFDGNGHSIANLLINRGGADNVGLFGWVGRSARLRGVGLADANVTGKDYVGALAGFNQGAVESCYAAGAVVGRNYVGGLAGKNGNDDGSGAIRGSFAAVAVSASGDGIGGLVGWHFGAVIHTSYAAGAVNGSRECGWAGWLAS